MQFGSCNLEHYLLEDSISISEDTYYVMVKKIGNDVQLVHGVYGMLYNNFRSQRRPWKCLPNLNVTWYVWMLSTCFQNERAHSQNSFSVEFKEEDKRDADQEFFAKMPFKCHWTRISQVMFLPWNRKCQRVLKILSWFEEAHCLVKRMMMMTMMMNFEWNIFLKDFFSKFWTMKNKKLM